jgi:hypothetical protein
MRQSYPETHHKSSTANALQYPDFTIHGTAPAFVKAASKLSVASSKLNLLLM